MTTVEKNANQQTPGVQIPLIEAQVRLLRFRESILGLDTYPADTSKTKACLIHMNDLLGLLSERDLSGIRCYLGLRWDDEVGQKVISLVMVGTRLLADGTHEDVIHADDPTNSGIFDFTAPCPNTCSPDSPLNHII